MKRLFPFGVKPEPDQEGQMRALISGMLSL
jgi:hypothetical protein